MKRNDKLKLDIVSNMDEEVVDEVTEKRYKRRRFLQKLPIWQKKWFWPSSVAALLVLCIGVVLLFQLLGKQVPIYRGMTVSNEAPKAQSASVVWVSNSSAMSLSTPLGGSNGNGSGNNGQGHTQGNGNGHDHHVDQDHPYGTEEQQPEIEEVVTEESLWDVQIDVEPIYYANPNELIYITIHIDNPDNYEILSFTLNEKKYSSYMFEDGSDMENLVLAVNVGDVSGVVEYTIDAIKYVDGTTIKDVRMDGDRTVRVGVSTEEQPTANVENETVGFNEIGFDVSISDAKTLISLSGGTVQAVLFDGEEIVATKDIPLGETTSVLFEGLKTNTLYQYAIVARYDALDKTGINSYTLYKKALYTRAIITYENVTVDEESIAFSVTWAEDFASKTLTSLSLWRGEEKVADLALDTAEITDLLSDNTYRIVATYQNGGAEESEAYTFTTVAKKQPTVTLSKGTVGFYEIPFTVTEKDTSNIATITKIELLRNGEVVQALSDLTVRRFENLYTGTEYVIRVTFEYDMNEGAGVQTETRELTVTTKGKTVPTLSVGGITAEPYALAFQINLSDPHTLFTLGSVKLTHEGNEVPIENALGNHSITGLIPNESYVLTVSYSYDLGDGNGVISRLFTKTIQTHNVITVNDVTYELSRQAGAKVAAVIAYEGTGTELLTFHVDGYTVTRIAGHALWNSTIKAVRIPSSVVTVEQYGINPNTVVYAEAENKPNGWTSNWHGGDTYEYAVTYWNFKEFYTDTQGVTYALCNDNTATVISYKGEEIELLTLDVDGYTVVRIAKNALRKTTVKSVIIQSSITVIDGSAIHPDTIVYAEIAAQPSGWHSNWNDGSETTVWWNFKELYTDTQGVTYILLNDNTATVKSYSGTAESVTIGVDGYTVTEILPSVFASCQTLVHVTIPEGVREIGANAFQSCRALETVSLPTTLTSIGAYAFEDCRSLLEIEIPEGVVTMGESTFGGCRELVSVRLPSTLKTIPTNAFSACRKLTEVVIPEGVERIEQDAFVECNELKTISLPSTLQYLGTWAFASSGLTELVIPQSVTEILDWAIPSQTIVFAEATSMPSGWQLDWHNDGTVIWNFKELYTDTQGVTYALCNDNTATVIGYEGEETELLTFGVDGYTVVRIAKNALWNEPIIGVIIQSSITTIDESAIYPDTIAYVEAATKPSGWESNWNNGGTVIWNFKEFYTDTQGVTYILFHDNTAIVKSYAGTAESVTIGVDGYTVTAFMTGVFANCKKLVSITIPEGLERLGNDAFNNCAALETVNLPSTLEEIEHNTFSNCTSLATIRIPAGVKSIGDSAFWGCNQLREVLLAEGLQTIGSYAFTNCSSLTALVIPSSVTKIGSYAFSAAWGIHIYACAESEPSGWQANWDDSVETVVWNFAGFYTDTQGVKYALHNNDTATVIDYEGTATSLVLGVDGYTLVSISARAFENCGTLTRVTVPVTVTEIGDYAFAYCSALTKIQFGGTMAEWNAINKGASWNAGVSSGFAAQCTNGSLSNNEDDANFGGFVPF